jgi:protein arginine kinase activator
MDNPITCKYCSKPCSIVYKELSLLGQSQIGLCKKCSERLESGAKETSADDSFNHLSCQSCHTSWQALSEGKTLGCCGCYETFQSYIIKQLLDTKSVPEKLRHFLEQDVKFQLHIGRSPFNSLSPDLTKQIQELELQLENALKTENYEQAAIARDHLSKLKHSQEKPTL